MLQCDDLVLPYQIIPYEKDKQSKIELVQAVLMGIAVVAAGNAFILVTSLKLERETYVSINTWNLGNLNGTTWNEIQVLSPWILILIRLAIFKSRELNALSLGKDSAASLGVHVLREQLVSLCIAVVLAAVNVSVAGASGFVGLIAPHIARRLVGASHQFLIITSVLVGALLVIVSDTIARVAFAPSEISVVGAPYFLYLLAKANK